MLTRTGEHRTVEGVLQGLAGAWVATAMLYLSGAVALPAARTALVLATFAGSAVGFGITRVGPLLGDVRPGDVRPGDARPTVTARPATATARPATATATARPATATARPATATATARRPATAAATPRRGLDRPVGTELRPGPRRPPLEPEEAYPGQCPDCGAHRPAPGAGPPPTGGSATSPPRCPVCRAPADTSATSIVTVRSWLHQGS